MRILYPDGRREVVTTPERKSASVTVKQSGRAVALQQMLLASTDPNADINASTMPMNISEAGKPVWRQMIERLGDKISQYGAENAGKPPYEETKDNPFWLRCAVGLTIYEDACESGGVVPYIGEGEAPTVRVPMKDEHIEEETPTPKPGTGKGGKGGKTPVVAPTPVDDGDDVSDGDDDLNDNDQAIIDALSSAEDNELTVKALFDALNGAFDSTDALKAYIGSSPGLSGKVSIEQKINPKTNKKTNFVVLSLPAEEPEPEPEPVKKTRRPATKPPKIVTPVSEPEPEPEPEAPEEDESADLDLLPGEHHSHKVDSIIDLLKQAKAMKGAKALGDSDDASSKWFKNVFNNDDHEAAHNEDHFVDANLTANESHAKDSGHWQKADGDEDLLHPPTDKPLVAKSATSPYLSALLGALYSNSSGGIRAARKQFLAAAAKAAGKEFTLTDGHGNQNRLQTYSTLKDRVTFVSPIQAKAGAKQANLPASYYMNFYQTLQSGKKPPQFNRKQVDAVLKALKSAGWLLPARLVGENTPVDDSAMFLAKTKAGVRTRIFRLVARAVPANEEATLFGFDVDISLMMSYDVFKAVSPSTLAKIESGRGWTAGKNGPTGNLPTATAYQTIGRFAALIARKGSLTSAISALESPEPEEAAI